MGLNKVYKESNINTLKMEKELSCNVSVFSEKSKKGKIYIARCEELGVSDFGDNPEEALDNLKKAIKLLIEVEPSVSEKLIKEKPLMTTRILL